MTSQQSALRRYVTLILPVVPALILLLPVHYKLTANPDSVRLFEELGMEPVGRVLVGTIESICIILLMLPGVAIYGAILTLAVMTGALIAHATHLGWANPSPSMVVKALVAAACSMAIIYLRREQLALIRTMFER